ncbi:MAG TPA: tetratricopeptide repeat protein, partial [Terriglobales bacterium]|nr:tetratricopeptide repeat protein [Terriglobales bacterium]
GYEIEASAAGYLPTQNQLEVTDSSAPTEIAIALRRDPAASGVDSADLLISPKARKLTKHAIGLLKSDRLAQAQKQLDQAYSLAPASPDLNFLLGYLYFKRKDFDKAGSHLATASSLSPQNAQTLTLLGRVGLEREDYQAARSVLEQAVLLDFENWLPHNLLAVAFLRQGEYEKAREEAEVAIRKGKQDASPSQLILGESLVELGRYHEGLEALDRFLQNSAQNPVSSQVRKLMAEIRDEAEAARVESAAHSDFRLSELDPLAALPAPALSIKSWQPRGVDDVKPYVVPGVTCPLTQVIDQAGLRVTQLVQDVERFSAVEELLHQALDDYGIPTRIITGKYNYVASMSEPQPGRLYVDEFRSNKLSLEGYPDHIATTGFAVLALVFHPHMRENFAMTCEGLGDWRGHATWLMHFRQREDRPNHMHAYKIGNRNQPVALKGRAWITADKFQIVRIEADLVHAIPEIQLLSEHQMVEYGPVPFPKKNTTVWLPRDAQIYFDFRKHRYYRRHSFDHYMLFSVDSGDKPKEPAVPPS